MATPSATLPAPESGTGSCRSSQERQGRFSGFATPQPAARASAAQPRMQASGDLRSIIRGLLLRSGIATIGPQCPTAAAAGTTRAQDHGERMLLRVGSTARVAQCAQRLAVEPVELAGTLLRRPRQPLV